MADANGGALAVCVYAGSSPASVRPSAAAASAKAGSAPGRDPA